MSKSGARPPSNSPPHSTLNANSSVNAEYVERCQLEFERNPQSRVFAPLAEAYRKLGLQAEALRICELGTAQHPTFAGGRVAFAKCLIDLKRFPEALKQLEKAIELSPDNLLGHSLMGETLLELRRPKEALKAFKMTLFLNPSDERARNAVRKWEFLTADEYEGELFAMTGLEQAIELALDPKRPQKALESSDRIAGKTPKPSSQRIEGGLERELERALSLADAFTVRNNLESALQTLRHARERLGHLPEIENRLALLARRTRVHEVEDAQPIRKNESRPAAPSPAAKSEAADVGVPARKAKTKGDDAKKRRLEGLLEKIRARRAPVQTP